MRAVSFGIDPQRYDTVRPGYPAAVAEDLVPEGGVRVLDVGSGTGMASRLFAAHGCDVLGVEPDERMAQVARSAGTSVEVGSFEAWDAQGRLFDLVVCAQAWWWLDRSLALPKMGRLLVPGGRLGVFWNAGRAEDEITLRLSEVYARVAPAAPEPMLPRDPPADAAAELDASEFFDDVATTVHKWSRRYTSADWAAAAATFSDVIALPQENRAALLAEIEATIDAHGGFRDVQIATTVVTARQVTT